MSDFPTRAEVAAEVDLRITNASGTGVIHPAAHGAVIKGTGDSKGKGILDFADIKAVTAPVTGGYESGWTSSGTLLHRIDNAGRCLLYGKLIKASGAGTTVHQTIVPPPATDQTFAVVAISGNTAFPMAIKITSLGVMTVISPPIIATYYIDLNLVYSV